MVYSLAAKLVERNRVDDPLNAIAGTIDTQSANKNQFNKTIALLTDIVETVYLLSSLFTRT